MSYRNDDDARGVRADALIREIADLERQKVARTEQDERLAAARLELASLQAPPPPPRGPGLLVHLVVFGAAAAASFVGYTLLA